MRKEDVIKLVELNNELLEKSKIIVNLFNKEMNGKIAELKNQTSNYEFRNLLQTHKYQNPFDEDQVLLLQDFYDDAKMTFDAEGVVVNGKSYYRDFDSDNSSFLVTFDILQISDDMEALQQEISKQVEKRYNSIVQLYKDNLAEQARLKAEAEKRQQELEQDERYKQWQELNKEFGNQFAVKSRNTEGLS